VFDSIIPLSLFFISRTNLIKIIIPITIFFIFIDFSRHHVEKIKKTYLYFFNKVTRKIENKKNTFTGATYYLLGCLSVLILFDNHEVIMASLLIMSISDSFAAMVGIKFGETKIYNKKSLEGSFSFFISAFIILVFFASSLSLFASILIAFFSTLVELFSYHRLNDNITVPICSAILIQYLI